jgi:hypothetical protein
MTKTFRKAAWIISTQYAQCQTQLKYNHIIGGVEGINFENR